MCAIANVLYVRPHRFDWHVTKIRNPISWELNRYSGDSGYYTICVLFYRNNRIEWLSFCVGSSLYEIGDVVANRWFELTRRYKC